MNPTKARVCFLCCSASASGLLGWTQSQPQAVPRLTHSRHRADPDFRSRPWKGMWGLVYLPKLSIMTIDKSLRQIRAPTNQISCWQLFCNQIIKQINELFNLHTTLCHLSTITTKKWPNISTCVFGVYKGQCLPVIRKKVGLLLTSVHKAEPKSWPQVNP